MEYFWILFFVLFFAINSLDKAESIQLEELEELPLQTFDELFVDEWWVKDEAEDLKTPAPTNFGQNVHDQIDRQNTQIGQIKPNSTDQNPPLTESDNFGQIEPNSTDQLGQIEPNSTDQNPLTESDNFGQIEPNSTDQNPLIEYDHSDNAINGEEQNEVSSNENNAEDERKRKIINKFHAMKDEFKQKGKQSKKEWNQIEEKIAKHLKTCRKKIYKWQKELGLSRKIHNFVKKKKEQKNLIEKFDQMKAELQRAGFKNSHNELDKTVAKELGLSFTTIYKWKNELGQTTSNKYPQGDQKDLMKRYYEIKEQNPKTRDEDIVKMLKIGKTTLFRWKKQFKRHAANVQEIGNSNSGSI